MHDLEQWFIDNKVPYKVEDGGVSCGLHTDLEGRARIWEYSGGNWDILASGVEDERLLNTDGKWIVVPSFTDEEPNEEPDDDQSKAKQLASDHWHGWNKELLENALSDSMSKERVLELVGFVYVKSFEHGYKHALQDVEKT